MNTAVALGIVLTIFLVTTVIRTCHDEEIDTQAALTFGIAVTLLVACAVVSYNEEETEDTQDCVCSCDCCERSETE